MVRIITDSAADFEPRELQEKGILCIPLTVTVGETEYQENVNLTKAGFYELMAASGNLPKTAQASPQVLLDLIDQAREAGDEVIYITLSSALSGTYQTALSMCRMADYAGAYVVDSRNATGGQRLVVEYAVKLRDAGKSAAEIVEAVEVFRNKIVLFACINTMENLYKGGRISQTAYALGNLAQIKPIITIDQEGKVAIPAKAMGLRKGMDMLCKKLTAQPWDNAYPLYVMYTDDRSVAENLAKKLEGQGGMIPPEHIIQVGAAIGTHIGAAACGLVYVEK